MELAGSGAAQSPNPIERASPVVCIVEDRGGHENALRILISSLDRHCPGLPIQLFAPNPSPAFQSWLATRSAVTLKLDRIKETLGGYDVKPQAIISLALMADLVRALKQLGLGLKSLTARWQGPVAAVGLPADQ